MKKENKKETCIEEYYRQRKEIIEHIKSGGSINDFDKNEYGL